MEEKDSDEWLKDLPVQTENVGFQTEEMIRCQQCVRMNPPTKLNCFYCGAELEISEAQRRFVRPNLRKLEAWEKGFNVIMLPILPTFDKAKIAQIARILKTEKEILQKIIEAGKPLPVARAESEKEAEIAQQSLKNFGIESVVVSDEKLNAEKPPRRLRGIEFFDDKLILILFNRDEIVEIKRTDLALIVTGAIFERRIEATETYNKKGENKILDSTETASDESVIDIYSREDLIGHRILAKGFDFSCLETEKGILAKDNIKKLAEKLKLFAPNGKFIDDYLQVREFLANVWELDQKSDSQGLKREGFVKFNLGNVTTVNNASQLTRYSRLHRNLL
ncbi:MAG: hypothetical protein LH472_08730 [Pyrinomonadaceae bacterium]|nr:hypothetical protein [Pyrinomonadaceae bacterium]